MSQQLRSNLSREMFFSNADAMLIMPTLPTSFKDNQAMGNGKREGVMNLACA